MNIARPPGGFKVFVNDSVKAYIEAESKDNFRISQLWIDLLDRIKITALREGTKLDSSGSPTFTYIAEGAVSFKIPTIQITYICFGDTLTVEAAVVWQDSDHEIDKNDSDM